MTKPSPPLQSGSWQAIRFIGSGGEYFGIWILNVFLIIVTLYIYAPWAKVRSERYFATHARFDGHCADYHARPGQLVVGSMVAFVLVIFLGFGDFLGPAVAIFVFAFSVFGLPLLSAWAAARSRRFRAGMSSWRNVRFTFHGTPGRFLHYRVIVPAWMLIAVFASVGLADPVAGDSVWLFYAVIGATAIAALLSLPRYRAQFAGYIASNYRFGDERFTSRLSVARVYAIHVRALVSGALLVLALVAVVLLIDAMRGGTLGPVLFELLVRIPEVGIPSGNRLLVLLFWVPVLLALATIPGAVVREALMRVHVFESTTSPSLSLRSSLTPRALVWLRVSNILLVLCTLGLAWPWARVRAARLMLETTHIASRIPYDRLTETQRSSGTGIGDEFGDVLETDMGFGF